MAKLYYISEWSEQSWWNTGGTRDKKIYLNPEDGELYYFKQSYNKGQRNYKHEFWSEIIASEIGLLLDFDLLPYHIAIRGNVVGCISKSMINQTSEELFEGGKYLQAFDNSFIPENIKLRFQYSFGLIRNSLISFKKEKHLKEIIEVIVFDALIGNSDRHQENWAIINVHTVISEGLSLFEKALRYGKLEDVPNWLFKIIKAIYTVKGKIRPEFQTAKLLLPQKTRFAPIYDSGCSFGRELEDQKVEQLLNNELEINKYIEKGLSEIHWEGIKINHFELIRKLLEEKDLIQNVLDSIKKVIDNFNSAKIAEIVMNVDNELVEMGDPNILPKERKEFILKLLTLRHEKLSEIYSQYK